MKESPDRKEQRIQRGEAFRRALLKHQERVPRGWQKEIAAGTGMTEGQVSKIVSGARSATVEQMIQIAELLKAPHLLPENLTLAAAPARATPRISADRGERSDLPATVAARPVPKDLAEYVAGRGQDEQVTVGEFVRLAKARFKEESAKPRTPDFWHGVLLAIRSE